MTSQSRPGTKPLIIDRIGSKDLHLTPEPQDVLTVPLRRRDRPAEAMGRLRLSARHAGLALAFITIYVGIDWAVNANVVAPNADTPWNPPPGLALAWLLIFGITWAPVLFLAVLAAEWVARGDLLSFPQALLISSVVAAGYVGLAWILRYGPLAIDISLSRMRDLVLFVLYAGLASLLVAIVIVLLEYQFDSLSITVLVRNVVRHWIGDLIGILVFTPLVLVWLSAKRRIVRPGHDVFAHGVGIFISALFAFWVVYGNAPNEQITSLYLVFLPLTWASIRFGLIGAVVTSLALQVGIIMLSHLGSQSDATVLQFQIRLLVIAVTGLFLGAAVDEVHATEHKLRERQAELDRTLRLAASSELASAMAHELNQPLSAIGIYTRTCELLLQAQPVPELRETMAKISVEVRRAGDVVHKLREFYRSGGSRLQEVAVMQLAGDAVAAIQQRAVSYGIDVTCEAVANLPAVSVDRTQIETVLHNLLANAIEAIRDANCPVRRIHLGAATASGNMVAIRVRDTGPGMSALEIEQLFRPFSSSKAYGLGLGLSMCRSIIAAHGGSLEVESDADGSCFQLTLPAAERAIIIA